jgi:hypothetical protein
MVYSALKSISIDRLVTFLGLLPVLVIGSLALHSPAQAYEVGTGAVEHAEQFPQTRATQVRHTIRLTIPTTGIDRLKIIVPPGIKVGSKIDIYNDTARQSLTPLIQQNPGNEIEIKFQQPLPPHTHLTIDLNRVQLWGLARTYRLHSQPLNSSGYNYLGSAEFDRY